MTNAPSLVHTRRCNLLKQPQGKGRPQKKSIWVVRTFDGSRIVLGSDLALHHFLFTEGDPMVSTTCYPYVPAELVANGNGDFCFDALVTYRDGSRVCRDVRQVRDRLLGQQSERVHRCEQVARQVGASYEVVTEDQLEKGIQRIRNWARLLAAYRRCSHRPLEVLEKLLMARLSREGETTFQSALNWAPQESQALAVAAFASLLRKRQIASDLDEATWSYHTRLWAASS